MPRIFIIPSMVLKIDGKVSSDIVTFIMFFVIEAIVKMLKYILIFNLKKDFYS